MTEQELRELDAEVAVEVMGLECWTDNNGQLRKVVKGIKSRGGVPYYSRDIAAAEQVLKRFAWWSLWFDGVKGMGGLDVDDDTSIEFSLFDEIPRTICRAALAAVRSQRPESGS